MDKLFAQFDRKDSPGCALAVVRDGRVVYKRGYGMADLEHDVPLTPQSVLYIGSTAKQFAAASVALLAQQGKLSLDDDVRKYVPELPDYQPPVTLRHLVHHTSGLRDEWARLQLAGRGADEVLTLDDIVALAARQKALNFKPGEEHLYSNTGYTLLAVVVARASGKSLREFADAEIFRPLGMARTVFNDDHTRIIRGRAYGYAPARAGGFRLANVNNDLVGAGGLWTSVEDLLLWDETFYTAKVGGPALIRQMQTPGALSGGEELPYAFGLNVGEFRGLKFVAHGGRFAGYRAELVRFPEQKFSVACLCNSANADPNAYAKQIVEIYLADQMKPREQGGPAASAPASPQPVAGEVKLSEQELSAVAGVYLNRVSETSWRIYLKGGKLYLGNETELIPLGAHRFTTRGAPGATEITFKPTTAGERPLLHFAAGGGKPSIFDPVESASYAAAQLSEFAGEYRSEEIDARYTLAVKDGKLMMRLRSRETPLEAVFADGFAGPGLILRFTRAAGGRIDGFTVSTPPARRVRFDKLKS
ncbi:MAG: beta-lactamase family protein [Acidobacteria bacterium]|nr:beta-lactamase family protein [Acidobacteriota bacterium]